MIDVIPDASVRRAMNEINAGKVCESSVLLLSDILLTDFGEVVHPIANFSTVKSFLHVWNCSSAASAS